MIAANRGPDPTLPTWFSRLLGALAPAKANRSLPLPSLHAAAVSIAGRRETNEDRCYCDPQAGVFLIADGIGGHAGGSLASDIVIETMPELLRRAAQSEPDAAAIQDALEAAIERARGEMIRVAEHDPDYRRMGCTVAIAVVAGDRLFVGHLGDCRCYLRRGRRMQRLTNDHTYVQALLDLGTITPAEARVHPWKHHVLNWVGVKDFDSRAATITELRLLPGDEILLTTDGLTDVVDDATLSAILATCGRAEQAAEQLAEQAMQQNASDNVSCIVARFANVEVADEGDKGLKPEPLELSAA